VSTAVLDSSSAHTYARDVLRSAGFSHEDADACADMMVESSLRGIDSHGLTALLATYAKQARDGVGSAAANPRVTCHNGQTAVLDAGGASGPRAVRAGLDIAIAGAREAGVGVVVVSRLGYLGALGWAIQPAPANGLFALAACNSMAFVAPAGGREALHGTNPIAIAIPCDPDPIFVDMRTNAFHMRDYWHSLSTDEPLPEASLLRADGSAVESAREIDDWDGIVSLPLAGAKGYGLALAIDVLTAAFTGMPIGQEVNSQTERDGLSAFLLVLDPEAFGPADRFHERVKTLAAQAHDITPIDERTPVLLPGERAATERRQRLRHGIPIDPQLWTELQEQLRSLNVTVPPPQLVSPIG
jgi:LDH2 family malate/lactate/ureidoglycolate dehydrogenase